LANGVAMESKGLFGKGGSFLLESGYLLLIVASLQAVLADSLSALTMEKQTRCSSQFQTILACFAVFFSFGL